MFTNKEKTVMNAEKNKHLFEDAPVLKAVLALEIPTVISQLITVVYNMADTFFIGQVGDPDQVAAASVCLPLFRGQGFIVCILLICFFLRVGKETVVENDMPGVEI